jgi:hypothetical protein
MNSKLTFVQSIKAGAMAAGLAAVINVILFFVFHEGGILVDTIFIQAGQALTVIPVLISSIVPTLIASCVFFLLAKYTKNGLNIFRIISLVLLVLSFANPFMIPEVTTGYAVALNVMHIVVVACLLFFISKAVKENK